MRNCTILFGTDFSGCWREALVYGDQERKRWAWLDWCHVTRALAVTWQWWWVTTRPRAVLLIALLSSINICTRPHPQVS